MPRILIADDNTSVRTAVKQLLNEFQDCEFLEAEDGQAAVSQALSSKPDVVILDLAMPVMDGLSAARKIRSVFPELPVFLLTMHCSSHLESEATASGVQGVVSKAQSSILIAAIRELFRGWRSPAATALPPEPAIAVQAEISESASEGSAKEGKNPAPPLRRTAS